MKVNNSINGSSIAGTDAASTKKSEKIKSNGYDAKTQESSSSKGSAKTEISSKARDMAKAQQVAADAPDVREAKIAELREKILNNKYNVSADAIADKLVDDHMSMRT